MTEFSAHQHLIIFLLHHNLENHIREAKSGDHGSTQKSWFVNVITLGIGFPSIIKPNVTSMVRYYYL